MIRLSAAGCVRFSRVVIAVGVAVFALVVAPAAFAAGSGVGISTLSTKPSLVSGSEVLARVVVPSGARLSRVDVRLNGRDVTSVFRASGSSALTGLVTGLRLGRNSLRASAGRAGAARLKIIDHPISGPIFSGPQQQPFICETNTFTLPVTGGTLGPPLDSNCSASASTRVDYVYMSTDGTFKALPDPSVRPADLAQTTTSTGHTVNYIVRAETGTINQSSFIFTAGGSRAARHPPIPKIPWPPAGRSSSLALSIGWACSASSLTPRSVVTPEITAWRTSRLR